LNIQLPLKINKMKKKNILIVGAGPVGLSAAWFLSSVPHLTIDIV
jgi:glycine/D-amino acid oxidase-like deaminating enzyme